jgi:GNAT superfamily N-acetyltransferase
VSFRICIIIEEMERAMKIEKTTKLEFKPLTRDIWNDFEKLFGKNGAFCGCWCMYWRLTNKEFKLNQGETNKLLFKEIINSGEKPGILAYVDGVPAGWIAISLREKLPTLEKSKQLKRIDEKPVWSIACFYVGRSFRKIGLMQHLIKAAINFAKENGATIVEGYPVEKNKKHAPISIYLGIKSVFVREGFEEAENRNGRFIMRYYI